MTSKDNSELILALNRLEETQRKNSSPAHNFMRGLVYGVGFFIGGTLLVALIAYVLSLFNVSPVIERLLNEIVKNIQ